MINPAKPVPSRGKLILLSVVIALLGGLLLIGIPGALMMFMANALLMLFEQSPLDQLGERIWPLAIMVSLIWPILITPLFFYHHRKYPDKSNLNRWLFSLSGGVVFGVLIAVFLMLGQ